MKKISVKIGFVPSYRPYGQIPPYVVNMRKSAIKNLEKIEAIDLVYPLIDPENSQCRNPILGYSPDGCVCSLDDAEVISEYFMHQKVDAIIIGALNFGDERSAAKIAEKSNVPVLLYATKEPDINPHPSLARVSDSYCGTIAIAAALYRRRLNYHYSGIYFHDEPEFISDVKNFVKAIAVKKSLYNARIGQIGVRPNPFESVGFDEIAMVNKFQQNVIYSDLNDLINRAKNLQDSEPDVMEAYNKFKSETTEISIADDWVRKAARLEIAINQFWNENHLSAMSIQCWPDIQRSWGVSICALLGKLTGNGLLAACEADTLGSLAMLASYSVGLGKTPPHFVDWTIQHRENPNWLLSWHCGNAPVSLANNSKSVALRSRMDMVGNQPIKENDFMAGLYQFQVMPGEVTFCRISEAFGKWKMLIAPGTIVPSDEIMAGTWSWVEVKNHARLYRTLVENGFIHHASMIHGNQVDALKLACKLMDIEPVVVE